MRFLSSLRQLLWIALLSGSAATAATLPHPSVGYVDLQRLVRASPLYGQLVHYNRAISALRETAAIWDARERAAALAGDDRALLADFETASTQLNRIAAHSGLLEARERDALAKLKAMRRGSSALSGAQAFTASEQQTSAAMKSGEMSDFLRYRDALLAQEYNALAQTDRALERRVNDAYAQRENEMREEESTLALKLVRRDAYRMLLLRVRANDVFHDATDRRNAERNLGSIDRDQQAALAALRAKDSRQLRIYHGQLIASATVDRRRVEAQIEARASADLDARIAILRAQQSQRALILPPPPSNSQPASGSIGALSASSKSAISGQLNATRKAFAVYRPWLTARTVALERLDARAHAAYEAEIAALQEDRATLVRDLERWVMYDAAVLARHRGIATISTTAAAHAIDLTTAVAALMSRDASVPTP